MTVHYVNSIWLCTLFSLICLVFSSNDLVALYSVVAKIAASGHLFINYKPTIEAFLNA